MKKLAIFVFMILLWCGPGSAAEPVYPDYSGFVNDFAGVIDAATRQKLEGLCRTLEQKTSAELAIAVVKTVEPLDPKTYAVALFEKWKIGKKGKDNGILMLLAMDERRIEIEVGYGLEGVINDAKAGEILDRYVVPFFKQGKFGEGLYNGAEAIAAEVAAASKAELGTEYQGYKAKAGLPEGTIMTMVIIAVVLLIMLSIFASGLASGFLGAVFGAVFGFSFAGMIGAIIGAIIGFVLSYFRLPGTGGFGGWGGGFGGGGWGGGGGGFGGGSSGGGGSGRSW